MADIETSPNIVPIVATAHFPEAGGMIEPRYHSKSAATVEQNEWLLDPEFDAMIEDALGTLDDEERMAKYVDLQNFVMEECLSIFIYDYRVVVALQDYVKVPPFEDPSQVYLVQGYNFLCRFWEVFPPE